MLVLTRELGERLILTVPPSEVAQTIVVMYVSGVRGKIKMGFECPRDIIIKREEIYQQENGETK